MAASVCEKCGGSGWKVVEREGLSGAEMCDCAPLEAPADLEAAANLPPLYGNASFDNFVLPKGNPIAERDLQLVMVKVSSYVRQFPLGLDRPGLMFIGPTGTGKTHLAVAVLRKLMARGFGGLFFDYIHLLESIRSGYDALADAADREAYQSVLDAEVLLLDDLGSHRVSPWIEDTVTAIVTHRCNYRKPMIVTTNLPDPDAGFDLTQRSSSGQTEYRTSLAEKIGIRARSRLFEMCEVVRMPNVGDYRLRRTR